MKNETKQIICVLLATIFACVSLVFFVKGMVVGFYALAVSSVFLNLLSIKYGL